MATAPHLITRVTKLNTLNIPYCLENKFPPMFATQFAELMFKIMGKINRNYAIVLPLKSPEVKELKPWTLLSKCQGENQLNKYCCYLAKDLDFNVIETA